MELRSLLRSLLRAKCAACEAEGPRRKRTTHLRASQRYAKSDGIIWRAFRNLKPSEGVAAPICLTESDEQQIVLQPRTIGPRENSVLTPHRIDCRKKACTALGNAVLPSKIKAWHTLHPTSEPVIRRRTLFHTNETQGNFSTAVGLRP